ETLPREDQEKVVGGNAAKVFNLDKAPTDEEPHTNGRGTNPGEAMTMEYKSNQAVKFKPRRLGHVNLSVRDLERSVEVYTQVFGIEEVRREPGIKAGFLSNGNTHHDVALIEVGILATQAGLNHLGWELENEVQLVEAYQRAQRAGLKIDFTANHQISHSVYLSDPEGNGHEFYADAMKDWRTLMRPDRFDMITSAWTPGEPPPAP